MYALLDVAPPLTPPSYDLPADLFTEGETRPTRTKKPKAAKSMTQTAPANNKRTVSGAGLDVRDIGKALM